MSSITNTISERIRNLGLERKATSGDGNLCGLFALAVGAAADPLVTCRMIDLERQHNYLQKFRIIFRQIQKKHVPISSEDEKMQLGFGAQDFLNVDTLAMIMQEHNLHDNGKVKFNLTVTTANGCYELYSYALTAADVENNVTIKDIFIHNGNGAHYEGYGFILTDNDATGNTATNPDNMRLLVANHSCEETCIRSTEYLKSRTTKVYNTGTSTKSVSKAEKKAARRKLMLAKLGLEPGESADREYPEDSSESEPDSEFLADDRREEKKSDTSKGVEDKPKEEEDDNTGPLPKYGQDIPENSKLVVLRHPSQKDDAWKEVRSDYTHPVRIKAEGVLLNFYPVDTVVKNWSGLNLHFSIVNQKTAPAIRLTFQIYRELKTTMDLDTLEKPEHTGWIQFSFGSTFVSMTEPRRAEISGLRASWSDNNKYGRLSFFTEGGTSFNLKCLTDFSKGRELVDIRVSDDELAFLKGLARLTANRIQKKTLVKLNLQLENKDFKAKQNGNIVSLDELFEILPNGTHPDEAFTSPTYRSYRYPKGQIGAQHNQMRTRRQVLVGSHPGLPYPAIPVFRDADEALVTLAYGSSLLQEEQALYLKTLSRCSHKIKLITVGHVVLGVITLSHPLSAGWSIDAEERNVIPPYTQVKLTIMNRVNDKRTTEAKGFVTADIFGINQGINRLLVYITNKKAEKFADMTVDVQQKADAPVFDVRVQAIVFEQTAALRMNALVLAYGQENARNFQEAWPALLNDGSRLEKIDALTTVRDVEPALYNAAWDNLHGAVNWNRAQKKFLRTIVDAPGAISICLGPGGSGKTTLIIHISQLLIKLGFDVIWIGARNSSLDNLCESWRRAFPNDFLPLRAYSASTEPLGSLSTASSSIDPEYQDQVLLELLVQVQDAKTTQRRGLPWCSVLQKVLDNSKEDRQPMMRNFTIGSEDGEPLYADGEEVDFRQHFRDSLDDLKDHPFSDSEHWSQESVSFFRQSYKALRAEVYQEARLIACTPTVSGTLELRQNFGTRHDSRGVARLDDECMTMSESETLIANTVTDYSDNIQMWLMFGDLRQTGYNPIAGDGPENTLNEFLAQSRMSLSERLVKAGHPTVQMTVQSRMHSVLFEAPNQLHYDCSVTTNQSCNKPLDGRYRGMMAEIRQLPEPVPELTEKQVRMLYLEVHNAPMMKSWGSNSKANPGYVTVVVTQILPVLRKTFGEQTNTMCAIITPYRRQLDLYSSAVYDLRKRGWKAEELPQCFTIDAFQGRERFLTLVDLVNDFSAGFMADMRRACVAFTRAKEVQIIVGGAFEGVKPPLRKTKWVKDATANHQPREIELDGAVAFYRKHHRKVDCWETTSVTSTPDQPLPADLYIPSKKNPMQQSTGSDVDPCSGEEDKPHDKDEKPASGDWGDDGDMKPGFVPDAAWD